MKVVAIIEARMKSTRLPGKNLRPILGKPMLEMLVERLRHAKSLDGVVVATTIDPSDDAIEETCNRIGVGCYRGSMDDVLDRVLRAAQTFGVETIVEITGDCPLTDPMMVDEIVDIYRSSGCDYAGNVRPSTYPVGLAVQVFATHVLEETERSTQDPADREHVSLYIYEHPELFSLRNVESGLPEKYRSYRLTVDTPEDFAVVNAVFEALYPANPAFGLTEMLGFLDSNPELLDLNRNIQQKAVR
ncbi:MAG: cytidylyltransferase domain-containing protein [Sulfuricella sp.]